MAWSGLGVNYKAQQSNWNSDRAYLSSVGVSNYRINLVQTPQPWAVGTPSTSGSYANVNAFWRMAAQNFVMANCWVTWGIAAPQNNNLPITSSNWGLYHDAVVAEATYLQSTGTALGDFTLGNELEALVDGTTVTVPILHTYLRQLALDVKAVYSLSPISYGCYDTGGTVYSEWISNGLGGLDYLSIHIYGNVRTSQSYPYVTNGEYSEVQEMVNAFGSKVYISEFNIDASNSNILLLNTEQAVTQMRKFYKMILSTGISKALVYSWVGNLNGNNQFAMQNTDGSFNPVWDCLLGNDRRTFIP
jgi:hypothetical protein